MFRSEENGKWGNCGSGGETEKVFTVVEARGRRGARAKGRCNAGNVPIRNKIDDALRIL